MSTAHKYAPRTVNRLFGAVSEPQRPTKEPVWCCNHSAVKAVRKVRNKGYCKFCLKDAVAESRKR